MEPTLFIERSNVLKKKNAQRQKFWDDRDAKIAAAKNANPEYADTELSADDKKFLDTIHGEIKDLNAEVEQYKEYQSIADRADAVSANLSTPVDRPQYGNGGGKFFDERAVKTAGIEFVDSPQFKSWLERIAPEGAEIAEGLKIESPKVDIKSLVMTTPTTAGGAFIRRDYGPWPVDLPLRQPTIRDVITVLRTSSNLIEYVRVNALTRAAAMVPEATSTTDDDALKPQSGMAFEIVQTGVKTIAVWMPITRTILADVPQLESMINAFLRSDLELELEEEIITGPGGANHFTGLENTPNLTPQPFDTDDLTTTRKARTKAMIVGRARSTAFLLNPYDWESLDLTKDAENRYYFGGPLSMGTKMLWGLPVIESEVIPIGTAYTGDLKQMVVWDRERPTMHVTDSNRDFFERNIISILLEERAAFGVLRPPAIVKIDLHAGANS